MFFKISLNYHYSSLFLICSLASPPGVFLQSVELGVGGHLESIVALAFRRIRDLILQGLSFLVVLMIDGLRA